MTQDTQAGARAQPAPAIQPVYLPLQQECADYATSLRSTTMQVKLEGRPEPQSMVRAADLFERAAARITQLDASASQLIEERDHAQDMADRLAQAISEEFRVDVGEHSNLNCPWHQALAVLNGEYTTDSDKDRCIAVQAGELAAARAETKHWRSNHDNVVARLRIFTQRPDIPKELADRLPWYRELVRLQEVEAQALPSVVVGPLAERGILDAIRSAYDLGYNDARSARAVPGDSAPGYKGRQVEGDHGGALVHLLKKLQAAPPAPAAVAVPVEREQFEAWAKPRWPDPADWEQAIARPKGVVNNYILHGEWLGWQARAALAAAAAQAQDDRAAFKAYLQECDDCAIVPDVAGAFHAAWQMRAAPAQAVAVPPLTPDEARKAAQFARLMNGPSDTTQPSEYAMAGALALAAKLATPAQAPERWIDDPHDIEQGRMLNPEWVRAQEHATQLAGQALPADEFRGDTASLVRNIVALLDLDAQGSLVPHGVGGHARGLLSAAASRLAAPAQAQEDARDLEWLTKEGRAHGFRIGQTIEGAVITHSTESLRAAIDAARAAQGGDKP